LHEERFNDRERHQPRGERANLLAWIRTGLAACAVVPVATRYAGLAMVVIGIAIVARGGFAFERTRRAIDRDEIIRIPQSRAESLLAAALAIAVLIFCINLAPI
jgi:putative membrane protein